MKLEQGLEMQVQQAMETRDWTTLLRSLHSSLLQSPSEVNWDVAMEGALAILQGGDFQQRWDCVKLFPLLGEGAIAPLMEILHNENIPIEQRWFAGRILGKFQHPQAITALATCLQTTEDEELGDIAATGLSNFGPGAISELVQLLDAPETRFAATRALCQIHRPEIVTPLLSLVGDDNPEIRQLAIATLSNFRDSRILPAFLTALSDHHAAVRKEAVAGIGGRITFNKTLNPLPHLHLLPHLKPLLYDFNLEVCQQAALAISRIKTPDAANLLFHVLQSPTTPQPLQLQLIRALAWMETPTSWSHLQHSLTLLPPPCLDEILRLSSQITNPNLYQQVAQMLWHFYRTQPQYFAPLPPKQLLIQAWSHLEDNCALEALQGFTEDDDPRIRLQAIAALKIIGNR
ncbi:HEAT repeat domain-containing protein [Spirulina sp. CS-785/01]|uniref:HEAT repeat domain-containing protein n=1 Tax=Spirulina sp. CS-785/01 TaxID=3021716 RepID=UPI00232ACBBB|nr:HEAT repeat domain-containing protein [Spirulina sp. CS-785/01]MDB9311464.1 HEAT repeat domain-containing protein [Spirulina sp. CS-785/01]